MVCVYVCLCVCMHPCTPCASIPLPFPHPHQRPINTPSWSRDEGSSLYGVVTVPCARIINGPHKAVERQKDSVAKHSHNNKKRGTHGHSSQFLLEDIISITLLISLQENRQTHNPKTDRELADCRISSSQNYIAVPGRVYKDFGLSRELREQGFLWV